MSHFQGMEELLQDFLTESSELLSDVDNKLVELEKHPSDTKLLNDIFRGFHTIKGGAGFLNVGELVSLCHLTENLFDKLRNHQLTLNPIMMDAILAATGTVRDMFGELSQAQPPKAADPKIISALEAAIKGGATVNVPAAQPAPIVAPTQPALSQTAPSSSDTTAKPGSGTTPDWQVLYNTLLDKPQSASIATSPAAVESLPPPGAAASAEPPVRPSPGRRATDAPDVDMARGGRRESDKLVVAETTIRIDTNRLDMVLNLSGEIGLAKNRLNCIRTDLLGGRTDSETMRSLDEAVSHLDLLVGDLQNAVMKTRMQPIGRLFQKYPRVARDLARQLGKNVELELTGEETELDKTMIEELSDPLIHLVRNAVDHGIELPEERAAVGKSEVSVLRLSAEQIGDHIVIKISDDGRGMRPDTLRRKAVEKGIIDAEAAANMDDKHALQLVFLPGFTTKDQISSVSGRGVGMDVVRTNINKLNGRIDIQSIVGQGSTFTISLPLTLAILPVLVVKVGNQPFAVPLSMVREIIPIRPDDVQEVSGKPTLLVRDEVLPIRSLSSMIGWPQPKPPAYGVLMQTTVTNVILAVDSFVGRDDVVMKPLDVVKPKGVAGATLSGDGSVVLVLDMEKLLEEPYQELRVDLFAMAA
jgi:two-component system chemotaxis sensor kinase CheA